MYMKAIRALLGVRATVPADLCLVEGGLKPLESLVKTRQKKFLEKIKNEFPLDETVVDKESRLKYSQMKSSEREKDVAGLRKLLDLPEKLDHDMDEDCELHCLMEKTKVN